MATAAGLVLGAVALYQLAFDSTQFICHVVEFPDDAYTLKVSFDLEAEVLNSWGLSSGLGKGTCAPFLNETRICAVLAEIHAITASTVELKRRYNLQLSGFTATTPPYPLDHLTHLIDLSPPTSDQDRELIQTRLGDIRRISQDAWVGRRLRWALWDHQKFESLVDQLHKYNQSLAHLLTGQHHQALMDEMKAIQLRNLTSEDPDKLRIIHEASRKFYPSTSASTRLKIARLVFDDEYPLKAPPDMQLPGGAPLRKDLLNFGRQQSTDRSTLLLASYRETNVLTEWKAYGTASNGVMESFHRNQRVSALARLLGEDKPEKLRALRCCGYIDDAASSKFCLVFEWPSTVPPDFEPISLADLIRKKTRPSLTHRFALARDLAESLMELLTVGWYHKALRPQNIIWFRDQLGSHSRQNAFGPFLVGFEYSRPNITDDTGAQISEGEPWDPEFDLYRHHQVLEGERFRPEFDIYSFGLVLLVVARWEMIKLTAEGLGNSPSAKLWNHRFRPGTKERDKLFHDLRFEVGDVFATIIDKCISGRSAFIADENSDLRFEFFEHIFKPLQRLAVSRSSVGSYAHVHDVSSGNYQLH